MIKSDSDPIRQVRSDWIILIRGSNSDSKKYNPIRSDPDQIQIVTKRRNVSSVSKRFKKIKNEGIYLRNYPEPTKRKKLPLTKRKRAKR